MLLMDNEIQKPSRKILTWKNQVFISQAAEKLHFFPKMHGGLGSADRSE